MKNSYVNLCCQYNKPRYIIEYKHQSSYFLLCNIHAEKPVFHFNIITAYDLDKKEIIKSL
jgi:hypothetical protein